MFNITPVIKWVGGKKRVIPEISKVWPTSYNTYYEPFIGGGAVLLHFQPNKAVINDLNEELINMYQQLGSPILKEYLLLMEQAHIIKVGESGRNESPFYKAISTIDRNEPNSRGLSLTTASPELRAARFIFLNKNGFNGLYRVNGSGYYNTPSKHKPTKTFDNDNINKVSEYLDKHVRIGSGGFQESISSAVKGDLVYLDPPYDYEVGTKGFDSYQKGGFGVEGQQILLNVCNELTNKGVKFIMSNHHTKLISTLFKDYDINIIKVSRLVGGKSASRKPVNEVLITNSNKLQGVW